MFKKNKQTRPTMTTMRRLLACSCVLVRDSRWWWWCGWWKIAFIAYTGWVWCYMYTEKDTTCAEVVCLKSKKKGMFLYVRSEQMQQLYDVKFCSVFEKYIKRQCTKYYFHEPFVTRPAFVVCMYVVVIPTIWVLFSKQYKTKEKTK